MLQACPCCGRTEPEVSFDADTCTLDCDECVSYRRALPRAYQRQDDTVTRFPAEGRHQRGENVAKLG